MKTNFHVTSGTRKPKNGAEGMITGQKVVEHLYINLFPGHPNQTRGGG